MIFSDEKLLYYNYFLIYVFYLIVFNRYFIFYVLNIIILVNIKNRLYIFNFSFILGAH